MLAYTRLCSNHVRNQLGRSLEPLVMESNVAADVLFTVLCAQNVAIDAEAYEQRLLDDLREAIASGSRNVEFFKEQVVRHQKRQVLHLNKHHQSPVGVRSLMESPQPTCYRVHPCQIKIINVCCFYQDTMVTVRGAIRGCGGPAEADVLSILDPMDCDGVVRPSPPF